jgi:hypothetical protein
VFTLNMRKPTLEHSSHNAPRRIERPNAINAHQAVALSEKSSSRKCGPTFPFPDRLHTIINSADVQERRYANQISYTSAYTQPRVRTPPPFLLFPLNRALLHCPPDASLAPVSTSTLIPPSVKRRKLHATTVDGEDQRHPIRHKKRKRTQDTMLDLPLKKQKLPTAQPGLRHSFSLSSPSPSSSSFAKGKRKHLCDEDCATADNQLV